MSSTYHVGHGASCARCLCILGSQIPCCVRRQRLQGQRVCCDAAHEDLHRGDYMSNQWHSCCSGAAADRGCNNVNMGEFNKV